MKLKLPIKKSLLMVLCIFQVNSMTLHAISYVGIATPALASTAARYLNNPDNNNDPHDTPNILYITHNLFLITKMMNKQQF